MRARRGRRCAAGLLAALGVAGAVLVGAGAAGAADSPRGTAAPVTTTTTAPSTGAREKGARVMTVPDTIASDCSVDVTDALTGWIYTAPSRTVLRLAPDGCYLVDRAVIIADKHDVTLDGNGATIRAITTGTRDRRHVSITGGSRITIRNLIVRGANPNAGSGKGAYNGSLAFQHAFSIRGTKGVLLDAVQGYDVYGDFVYVGSLDRDETWSSDVTLRGSRFEGSGRQGISIVAGKRIVIDRNYFGGAGQSLIDLEANTAAGGAVDVRITNNTTGSARHFWLANKGVGLQIRDIVVENNTASAPTAGLVFVFGPITGFRGPFTFTGNRFAITGAVSDEGSRAAFFLSRAEDVTITGNTVASPPGRQLAAVENRDSVDVKVSLNDFLNLSPELIVTHRPAGTVPTTVATTTTTRVLFTLPRSTQTTPTTPTTRAR